MKTLHALTLTWAKEKGLLDNGLATTQALKLGSEVGELNYNLGYDKPIDDDIGDIMVVFTSLCYLRNLNLLTIIEDEPIKEHIKPPLPLLNSYLGLLQDKILKDEDITSEVANMVQQMKRICSFRNADLKDSWNSALNEISGRVGELNALGSFIKEEL